MRYKWLRVSAELLCDFLQHPSPSGITVEGFPADARIVGARWEEEDGVIALIIESNTFELPPGRPLTEKDLEMTPLYRRNAA